MEGQLTHSLWWPAKGSQRFLLAVVLGLGLFGASCAFFRIRHPRDIEAFLGMAASAIRSGSNSPSECMVLEIPLRSSSAAFLRPGERNLGVTECTPSVTVPRTESRSRAFQSSAEMGNFFRLQR